MVKQVLWVLVLAGFAGLSSGAAFLSDCRAAESNTIRVKIETNKGDIVVALDSEKAPITVANFMQYVADGYYEGTIFHRVVSDFVIQGGGFDENMNRKPTRDPIQNEAGNGLSNEAYTIAMARTPDPDSATSQFYINLKDNLSLDRTPQNPGYTVFGKVVAGTAVVDAIGRVNTVQQVPVETVLIKKISQINGDSPDDDDNPDDSDASNDNDDNSTCFIETCIAGH